MNEKKSLDFNFLDEGSKDAVELTTAKPKLLASEVHQESGKVGIVTYFKECYTDFVTFSSKYLIKKNPKYLIFVIWVLGAGVVADRLSSSMSDFSSWGEVWIIVIIGGILAGALNYFVAGWFYNVRIVWSKGVNDIDASRNVYAFSTLPISIVSIFSLFFNQIAYGDDYLTYYYSDGTPVDFLFLLLFVAALSYSIFVSYKTAHQVLKAERNLAIGWFVVAPALFYVALVVFSAASA